MSYSLQSFDLATLDTLLVSEGVDPIATNINNFLISRGDTRGVQDTASLISVQIGTPPFPVSPPAQVDDITSPGTYSINTDQYSRQLQTVVLQDTGGPQNLTVTGSTNMLIATGAGTNTITLEDSGNDEIQVGAGSNTVTGGLGRDSIYGNGTADLLTASSANRSFIYEGGSHSTLVGGSGRGDNLVDGPGADNSLVAGHAHTWLYVASGPGQGAGATLDGGSFDAVSIAGGSGAGEHLIGSGNDDVLYTGSNKHEHLFAGGNNDSLYAGGAGGSGNGGGTLVGGGNDDQFYIGAHGNDTITGTGGGDAVFFESQAYGTGAGITIATASSGVTTVSFASTGQNFTISGIQTLNFSDGHVVHL